MICARARGNFDFPSAENSSSLYGRALPLRAASFRPLGTYASPTPADMPLATRYVEPRSVCATPLLTVEAARAGDALQAVAVRALAGVIRQLGSLAKHAEGLMGELAENIATCHARTLELEKRTRTLMVDVLPNLDADREVLEGFEIPHPDFQFKSDKTMDQRILSQTHAPPALLEQYHQANAPPSLSDFDADWEDGRCAMHVYSKPDFFFQSWREGIQRKALKKMSQMDLLSPTHESSGSKKKQRSTKQKHALENSTGSDRVSSSARPAKRTFSLSRKPHPRKKSVYGSVNSLNTDPGYNSMPGHTRRSSVSRRSSPSFRSVRNYPPSSGNRAVVRSQSLRSKPKRRPKLHSLSRATASMYVEQDLDLMLPKLTLEESAKYEYDTTKPIVKNSSLRRSNSLRKSKSRSPIAPTAINSVYGTMHMYTVTDEIARRDSSPLATLSKYYLERLALGTTSFDMSLAIEVPKKEHTSFRSPIGVRQRPVSSLDMQLVAMRNDGTAASRLSNLRLKQVATARADEKQDSLPASNGPIGNGVILRKRIGLLGDVARPASASFVDPPTVKKVQASSRMSLRSHGGSLTDLTQTASPAQTPTQPAQPKRQAPQAPMRTFSRTSSLETPTSGHNTPKGLRKHSPLVASHSNPLSFQSHSSPHSSHDTLTGGGQTPNGRITPVKRSTSPTQHRRPSSPQLPMVHRNTSSPQLTMAQYNMNSHPHPPVHHNTSSSQIPVALISPPLPAALNSPQLRMAQHNASSPQFPVFHSNPNSPQRPMGHRNPSLPQSLAVHQSPVSPQAVVSPQSAIPQQSPMVYQNHAGSPVSPVVHCMPGSPQLPMIHRRPSSPQLPTIQCRSSSPQLPVVPHRTNSPQLPTHHRRPSSPQLLMIPIQEEESMATTHFGLSHTPTAVTPRDMTTPTLHVTNGHIPKVFKRQESLYISPRKQSLTIESMENLANSKHLRVSQILQTGGITGGDLSSSRLDLLEAIRKGIELKQVKQEEQERENLQNMPWDVAAILERRRVLEMDTGSSDDESNVTDWEDD